MKLHLFPPKPVHLVLLFASIFWLAITATTEANYKGDSRYPYQSDISFENALFASPPSCDYSIPQNVMIIDGTTAPYNTIGSGDVVCLEAGVRQGTMRIQNFEGSANNPIIFTNHNGKVVIENGEIVLRFQGVQHVRFTGSGDANVEYGIELRNAAIAVRGYAYTQYLEIDHVEVHQTSGIGITMPRDAQYDNTVRGLYIHHNYLHDIGTEGLYIGESSYNQDPNITLLKDIEIAYNTLERLGWDGIQVGATVENIRVHHNHIKDSGLDLNSGGGNGGVGIMMNPGATGDYYNNTIINTRYSGIYDQGLGNFRLFNNLVINAGTIADHGGEGIQVWSNNGAIYNNTIINSKSNGIVIDGSAANGAIYNNIVAGSGYEHIKASAYTKYNNLESDEVSESDFVDSGQNNYNLSQTSPAINAADMQNEVPAFDLNDAPRDALSDIGAYEYLAPTPLPPIGPVSNEIVLTVDGPDNIGLGETVDINVIAQNVPTPGLYGVQFEINFNPALISVSNLQINPNLSFVLLNNIDNTNGKIRFVASQQGKVPGLTDNITLLSFNLTANNPGSASLAFENQEMSDAQAQGLDFVGQSHTFSIEGVIPPEPTNEPTPEPTSQPTDEPTSEPTSQPTNEPTPEPTSQPTDEPTPEPTSQPTDEPTPEPQISTLFGQVILAGRANNDWSDATVTIGDNVLSTTTDSIGNFSIGGVEMGSNHVIVADADGYLPSRCSGLTVNETEVALTTVTLLSGDINDDDLVDITDATAIGATFGQTGSDLPADINRDEILNIFDIVLVTINFGEEGPQNWDCINN